MKNAHANTAGIDIAKAWLDIGLKDRPETLRVSNDAKGFKEAIAFLKAHKVERVGAEATGCYGLDLIEALRREALFEVVLVHPVQIKLYRTCKRKPAKTDLIDALLIAEFVAGAALPKDFSDPRLADLSEHLLYLEQQREDCVRHKGRIERYRCPDLIARIKDEIARLHKQIKAALAAILAKIKKHPDLAKRFELLTSIPGLGPYSAAVLVIRLPELGHLQPGQIAALVGVAPFNNDSGRSSRQRRIAGGRKDIRDALYTPTLAAATRWNPDLVQFHKRLKDAGKPTKVAIIAAMRKLLASANAILKKGTPWQNRQAQH